MTSRPPRTLADWLNRQDDAFLARLFRARPDVAFPPPQDTSSLASRLSVRISVSRALDDVDAWSLQVLDGLLLGASPGSVDEVLGMLTGVSREDVAAAVDRLRALALVWGEDDALNVPAAVRESASRFIGGLGRPAAELFVAYPSEDIRAVMRQLRLPYATQPGATALVCERLRTPSVVRELLASAPPGADAVLDRLSGAIPAGELSNADQLPDVVDESTPPVRWLLAHGLLAYVGPSHLEMPREVGLVLRGDATLGPARLTPPASRGERLKKADVDGAGATHLQEVTRLAAELLRLITIDEPRVLRTGGMGTREVRKLAKSLGSDTETTHLLLHIAHAAGLLANTSAYEPTWLPTPRYDEWLDEPVERQWATLAEAWLLMPALSWLADGPEAVHALSEATHRVGASAMRRRVLEIARDLGTGRVADAATVTDQIRWRWPRRSTPGSDAHIVATLREAELLGVTGRGALTGMGRALLDDSLEVAAAALTALPEPVDNVILQPDLTAIAPGRLSPGLAHDMHTVSDLESSGGAAVFRITEASLRRALDAGLDAGEIKRLLRERSVTEPPQALDYLIDDVARKHGVLRVGGASAYLRCDDEATIDLLESHRALAHLRLRRLAPTVLLTTAEPTTLLAALEDAGVSPSFENDLGVIEAGAIQPPRAQPRIERAVRRTPLSQSDVETIVHRLRTGTQAAAAADPERSNGASTSTTLAVLKDAVQSHDRVSLDYVDENARMSTRLVTPSRIEGGFLYGYDSAAREVRRFAIHRIMAVSIAFSE
ncbi:helicase-associated domain-containing protein [Blastococcus sp. Marseille-P5729]|uniref:helicase-associated domain-containing protein n=1 Tax=Blastococcus sp. Marseille-P5729 TaxID=2086582 RepID=UPI000D10A76E|nr:helicase-associated domain-containing protein [Blastococcus sp. Marseille-P5729]